MDLQQIKPGRDEDFRESVLESAQSQAKAIVTAAERARERALRDARTQCEKADYGLVKVQQQRETQRKSAEAATAVRGEVLQYRARLVEDMFAEVQKRLQAFAQSREYVPFLRAKLKKYEKQIRTEDKPVVYVNNADLAHEAPLKKMMPQAEVQPDDNIELGGFKLAVGHTMFDETLDEALQRQRQAFYAQSKLEVNINDSV
jgi:vacuolar-type H+-ATPase subunit E/Vma4